MYGIRFPINLAIGDRSQIGLNELTYARHFPYVRDDQRQLSSCDWHDVAT